MIQHVPELTTDFAADIAAAFLEGSINRWAVWAVCEAMEVRGVGAFYFIQEGEYFFF